MNAATLNQQLLDAADDLRGALSELDQRSVKYAKAEKEYRAAKATSYLSTTGTVAEREAHAERAINELRFQRDMADGLRTSALEAVRSKRGILSAIQTVTNLYREEAGFDRTGPQEGVG